MVNENNNGNVSASVVHKKSKPLNDNTDSILNEPEIINNSI